MRKIFLCIVIIGILYSCSKYNTIHVRYYTYKEIGVTRVDKGDVSYFYYGIISLDSIMKGIFPYSYISINNYFLTDLYYEGYLIFKDSSVYLLPLESNLQQTRSLSDMEDNERYIEVALYKDNVNLLHNIDNGNYNTICFISYNRNSERKINKAHNSLISIKDVSF
ncbi:MAG: hypothetical protein ACTTJH_08240 [Bacteroidales bacterium]